MCMKASLRILSILFHSSSTAVFSSSSNDLSLTHYGFINASIKPPVAHMKQPHSSVLLMDIRSCTRSTCELLMKAVKAIRGVGQTNQSKRVCSIKFNKAQSSFILNRTPAISFRSSKAFELIREVQFFSNRNSPQIGNSNLIPDFSIILSVFKFSLSSVHLFSCIELRLL